LQRSYAANGRPEIQECAIDLCKDSRPYQIVVAMVEPNESLAQTLDHVRRRIQQAGSGRIRPARISFGEKDSLRVPEMFWRIDHQFEQLIGRSVANANPTADIVEAVQSMQFRLDRSGATLETQSRLRGALGKPRLFIFSRPFLIYMQKRGAERPFFVMWVDNAELLVRR
jgi:hypothetical protein